jgi:hypothetical protein
MFRVIEGLDVLIHELKILMTGQRKFGLVKQGKNDRPPQNSLGCSPQFADLLIMQTSDSVNRGHIYAGET